VDWQNFSIKKNQKQNQQKPVEQNHGIFFLKFEKKNPFADYLPSVVVPSH